MQEIGIESSLLEQILAGQKTMEIRLGKPKFLKIRVGDLLKIREDVWKDGAIVDEIHDQATIKVKQLLYFESFDEMLSAVDYRAAQPTATSKAEALQAYRQFYSKEDEYEYGVVTITFEVV